MSKLFEQIKEETETQCYIDFDVNEDGTLDYDKAHCKEVEPKLKTAWSKANVFDILSQVYINDNGRVYRFTLEVVKKMPARCLTMRLDEVEVQLFGDCVVAEFGGVVTKNLKEIITDIRTGYLPRVMEDFENSDITQLKVDVCLAQLRVKKCKDEYENALSDLKEVRKKLEEYRKNGGNYYGRKEKNN